MTGEQERVREFIDEQRKKSLSSEEHLTNAQFEFDRVGTCFTSANELFGRMEKVMRKRQLPERDVIYALWILLTDELIRKGTGAANLIAAVELRGLSYVERVFLR